MRLSMTHTMIIVAICALQARADVSLTDVDKYSHNCFRLDNGRVSLVVDPSQGGKVVSYKDKLGGDVELVPEKSPCGLCIDHFQQFPGELYDAKFEVIGQTKDLKACMLTLRCRVTGNWYGAEDDKIKDLVLEKAYTLRAGSPTLECRVKITAPKKDSKLFNYWQQNIFFAGGQYDRMTDKTFRPSIRGVRVKAGDNFGHTGLEELLRDCNAGWIALLDTQRKTGLVVLSDYNEIDTLYANSGNVTIEPMFRLTYLPAGRSMEYVMHIVPVVGLDNVVSATPDYIAGYHMKTDSKGTGTIALSVIRSQKAPTALSMKVSMTNVQKPAQVTPVGTASFTALGDGVQTKELAFQHAGDDPLVLKVETESQEGTGAAVAGKFEEYFNGAYSWGENITVDMATPVYRGERPRQKLTLYKPDPLRLKTVSGQRRFWYAEGLLDDYYQVTPATQMCHFGGDQGRQDRVFTQGSLWGIRLTSFPYDYDELLAYDMLILGGVTSDTLGNVGQEMICDYLKAGGGLIMLGGPVAYGPSHLHGTPLADMLPVTISSRSFDMEKLPHAVVKPTKDGAPFLENLDWSAAPRVRYLHKVETKSWGKVVLEADGCPVLVIGEVGPRKARVACIMGVPMGTFARGQTPFWEWDDWKYLLQQLNWWVLKEDDRFTPATW